MEKDIESYFKKFYNMKPYLFIDKKEWKHIMDTYEKDDVIEELCNKIGVECIRGPENDLVTRCKIVWI